VQLLQAKGVFQLGDTGTRKDRKTTPAKEQRCDKDTKTINNPGMQGAMMETPSPFKQDALDAARPKLAHGINQIDGAGTAGDTKDLDPL
jgi:hypothetical protein